MAKFLHFKNGPKAFEYIGKYFTSKKLKLNESYYGLVREIDKRKTPFVYMVSIFCEEGLFFKKNEERVVTSILDPSLKAEIKVGELVHWVYIQKEIIPVGGIIKVCNLSLNLETGSFEEKSKISSNETEVKKLLESEFNFFLRQISSYLTLEKFEDKIHISFDNGEKELHISFSLKDKKWDIWDDKVELKKRKIISLNDFINLVLKDDSSKDFYGKKRQFKNFIQYGFSEDRKKKLEVTLIDKSFLSIPFFPFEWNEILLEKEFDKTLVTLDENIEKIYIIRVKNGSMSIYQGSNENLTFDEDLKLVYPETNIKDIKGFYI